MKPLPRATPGSVVTLDGDLFNCIAENLQRMDKWSVQPPLNLQQTPAGNLLSMNSSSTETVLVAITGILTGAGYYTGCIMQGRSNGGNGANPATAPATYDLNIQGLDPTQTQTDGPAFPLDASARIINNALIVNLPEQYVPGSHKLYFTGLPYTQFAVGRVMGTTSESTPRTIVYIDAWAIRPVVAKITATFLQAAGGTYIGEIVPGPFASGTNSQNFNIATAASRAITGNNDCWITNVFEQSFHVNGALSQVPVGTYVFGIEAGWPVGSFAGGHSTTQLWRQVYTWQPLQAAAPTALGAAPTSFGMSASAAYTSNEQSMLNRLVTDVQSLWDSLSSLKSVIKAAGYTL